jgi:hypothetical protein
MSVGDFAMADLDDLPPHIRCALVGQFLQAWSAMELSLENAIGAALNIESIKLWILSANLRFRDKTNILRTLVDVSSFPQEEKDRTKLKIRKLADRAGGRNMIAHNPFAPDDTGKGVKFLTVKARGDYDAPSVVWLPRRFLEERRVLNGYSEFLERLEKRFKERPLTRQNWTDALLAFPYVEWPVPRQRISPQALLYFQSHPLQDMPDSGQATEQKGARTPDKPEEKP